ncbi:Hypothetical protein D9617_19g103520 [Elsinoe fawcettii]|nr:Hypothetical protein D9617_19g103520 [Elsinoe fawcettii]
MITPSSPPTLAPPSLTETTYVGTRFSLVVPRIPNFVRRAVPQLGAFQRVQKLAGVQTQSSTSHTRSWSSDMAGSGTVTPPPSYSETLAPLLTPMKFARRQPRKSEEKASTSTATTSAESSQDSSSIKWKFATQGLSLLSLAAQETTSSEQKTDTPFARQLYIHALTYLLRALPSNLSAEESTSLSASLPPSLLLPPSSYDPDPLDEDPEEDKAQEEDYFSPHPSQLSTKQGSLLYRLTSSLIIRLFLFLAFLLPWIQYLCALLLRLNREHHLSERLLSTTLRSTETLGRGALGLSSSLLSLQEGRVGRMVEGALQWWVRGVSGGLWEGVGEGMAILGLREEAAWGCQGGRYEGQEGWEEYGRQGRQGQGQRRKCAGNATGSVRGRGQKGRGSGKCAR